MCHSLYIHLCSISKLQKQGFDDNNVVSKNYFMCGETPVFDSGYKIFNNVRFTLSETGLLTTDGSNMYSGTLHNWKLWCGTFLNCQIQFSVLELTCSGFHSKVRKITSKTL